MTDKEGLAPEIASSFCLAVAAMKAVINSSSEARDRTSVLAACRLGFLNAILSTGGHYASRNFDRFSSLCLCPATLITWPYRALEQFFPLLRADLKNGVPPGSWNGEQRTVYDKSFKPPRLPLVEEIPFHKFMDLPLPFSKNSIEEFQRCHVGAMISKAFAEDGDWIGCKYSAANLKRVRLTLHQATQLRVIVQILRLLG